MFDTTKGMVIFYWDITDNYKQWANFHIQFASPGCHEEQQVFGASIR